jgi:MFS family permease
LVFAIFLVLFVSQELRHSEPILPVRLFRNRTLLIWTLLMFVVGAGLFTATIYLPTFVQTTLGQSATTSGLLMTPQSVAVLTTSVIGGQLIARTGRYRWLTIAGATLLLTGTALLSTLGEASPVWHVSTFVTVMGLGFGLLMPVSQVVVQNAVPHELLGVSTSARQFFLQMGQVLGTAVFGVLLTTSYTSLFHGALPPDARREIPATTLARFDDPTITLDATTYAAVRDEVLARPNGDAELTRITSAQRHAVAVAVHRLLQITVLFAGAALVLVLIAREVPLRRSFNTPMEPVGPE